jgi:outer membrane protein OmpA-like peptidoglycan-associated protein
MNRQRQNERPKTTFTPAQALMLQRACTCGSKTQEAGGCEECGAERGLQRPAINSSSRRGISHDLNAVLSAPSSPLDSMTRSFTESAFGQDFSSVRLHTGTQAADSARSVNARAYTVGNHIVLGNSFSISSSHERRRLIAHELTHTIQQRGVASAAPQAKGIRISEPGDQLEREADAVAGRVARGQKLEAGNFIRAGHAEGRVQNLLRQKDKGEDDKKQNEQKKADEPWIPIPVFDEFDPMVIAPDVPGVPDIVKGQKVALSQIKKALDTLRGKKKGGSDSKQICALIPGMEIAELGKFAGQCCVKFKRDEDHCCTWRSLSLKDNRCCKKDEVLLPDNHCFKPQLAPPEPPTPKPPTPVPEFELKLPRIRFGTIESTTIDKFALNSATIPAAYEKDLDHLAGLLKIYKDAEIHIEGHTDSSFTEEFNKALSDKRAEAVKKALEKRRVSTAKMTVVGLGESQLRYPAESTEEEKAANRRVDVWFYTPPSKTMAEELRLDIP